MGEVSRIAKLTTLASMIALAAGCRDLDRFRLEENETYCGGMVGSPAFQIALLPKGLPQILRLRLDLDVDSLSTRPGALSTDDADRGYCAAISGEPLFARAPLRGIDQLMHDQLSSFEFGDGHELNLIAWVDSNCQGTMLSIVSLMQDGSLEVRLLKPAELPPPDAPDEGPGYGLFHLARRPLQSCDF
jgi:hypothetical protein